MKLKSILIGMIITFLFTSFSLAEINSKKDADKFLKEYCIDIVAIIEYQYKEQKIYAKNNDWVEFENKGKFIVALADLYNKLCK
ncbi:MAG: hypothetical protein CFH01_00865 [Alphaproteobacteria bacterium MarineAlpha2_Bin1]|nr:MAG: hypothetical protein CFH01_00865 [Alphaproteobacteria bacterium MarineAlpha2_Bin1]|tara:strand:+ start:1593 stop:1844 length:252 start_codon:yes stop_codon:yes gene_type:complete